jgi:hypothetical protein
MTAPSTAYRNGCGTHLGLRLHQVNGEPPCAQCRHGEAIRLLELELIPARPTSTHLPLVTPAQAQTNRLVLEQALNAKAEP